MAGNKKKPKIVPFNAASAVPSLAICPGSMIMVSPQRDGTLVLTIIGPSLALRKLLKGIKPKK